MTSQCITYNHHTDSIIYRGHLYSCAPCTEIPIRFVCSYACGQDVETYHQPLYADRGTFVFYNFSLENRCLERGLLFLHALLSRERPIHIHIIFGRLFSVVKK
uniref:Uncharacterized protein n=1 Tax=Sipha flava TaxID=143950 RepID=A0A2S2QEC3_9HEMI